MLVLCDTCRVLNSLAVSPTYFFMESAVLTVASYTTFLALHFPSRGYSISARQLHSRSFSFGFSRAVLWPLMSVRSELVSTFRHQKSTPSLLALWPKWNLFLITGPWHVYLSVFCYRFCLWSATKHPPAFLQWRHQLSLLSPPITAALILFLSLPSPLCYLPVYFNLGFSCHG